MKKIITLLLVILMLSALSVTVFAVPEDTVDITTEAEISYEDVSDDKGNVETDDKGNKVTQKVTVKTTTKKPATGKHTGGNAVQIFDIGIAVIFSLFICLIKILLL